SRFAPSRRRRRLPRRPRSRRRRPGARGGGAGTPRGDGAGTHPWRSLAVGDRLQEEMVVDMLGTRIALRTGGRTRPMSALSPAAVTEGPGTDVSDEGESTS